jgi:dihydrofolate reductase
VAEDDGRVRRQVQRDAEVRRLLDARDPSWNNTTILSGDVADEVSALAGEVDGDIVVHGSARLVQTLIEHGLVDELRLMVFPVVLGCGKRLFGETSDKHPMRLADSKVVGDGVAILTYEPAA